MSSNENDNASQEINPHKELLKEAADQIHADQVAREKARPQNVGQGTLGLVGDSLGGAAMGAAAVVMGPVQGYKQNGAKGIIGGALGGLAVGVASATFGIGSGIAKFAHGASKTASGFQSSEKDPKLIVQDDRAPIQDVYHAERNRLYSDLQMEHSKESANASMHGLAAPVDNKLYKVLEISPDATPGQIRKAYYRMAQQYHPDKHPDSPEATAKFQEISEAYQYVHLFLPSLPYFNPLSTSASLTSLFFL